MAAAASNARMDIYRWRYCIAVSFVAIAFLYYFSVWYLAGRDPHDRAIIPQFSPPQGVEPGFAAYLTNMCFVDEALAADILLLAVRGFVYFLEESGLLLFLPMWVCMAAERRASLAHGGLRPFLLHAALLAGSLVFAWRSAVTIRPPQNVSNRIPQIAEVAFWAVASLSTVWMFRTADAVLMTGLTLGGGVAGIFMHLMPAYTGAVCACGSTWKVLPCIRAPRNPRRCRR